MVFIKFDPNPTEAPTTPTRFGVCLHMKNRAAARQACHACHVTTVTGLRSTLTGDAVTRPSVACSLLRPCAPCLCTFRSRIPFRGADASQRRSLRHIDGPGTRCRPRRADRRARRSCRTRGAGRAARHDAVRDRLYVAIESGCGGCDGRGHAASSVAARGVVQRTGTDGGTVAGRAYARGRTRPATTLGDVAGRTAPAAHPSRLRSHVVAPVQATQPLRAR